MPIVRGSARPMHRPAITFATATLAFLITSTTATPAGTAEGVVRGEVTDGSDGVLPGVTVVATARDGRVLATTVTDDVGRYVLSALPVGPVTLTFQLDGFDTGSVELVIQPGIESRVVERLRVAQITERVVVYGKAPVDSPRLSRAPYRPVLRPVVIPVPIQEMESICQPAKPAATSESIGTIRSHRHELGRTLYAKGDELNVDGGTLNGLEVGRNLVARRYYRANSPDDPGATGEHTAGLVQIVTVTEHSSTAVVVHVCSELMQGDFLASFRPEPIQTPDPIGMPAFEDAVGILFADAGQMLGATGRRMVIDRGSALGIQVGQRLTLFRTKADAARPFVIGEAVVVSVRTDSATIRVENATDAIWLGDWAAPQLPSPLEPPLGKRGNIPRP